MKLLYIAQYFGFPEKAGGTRAYDLATSFAQRGIQVRVITSDTSAKKKERWSEFERDGIKFYQLSCPYNNKMGFIKRIKSFIYFLFFSSIKALTIDCDVVLATSTPLTIGVPALLMKWIRRKPFIFEVRDVWPGVPIAMGFIKNKFLQKILYLFEKKIYKNANTVVLLSIGMEKNIKNRYTNIKSMVIPNISEIMRFSKIKKEINIDIKGGEKILLYAGTFGNVNGLNYVVKLASYTLNIDSKIHFYLFGEGKEKESVIENSKNNGVFNKNLFIFNSVKKSDLPYLYSISTVGSSFVINIPALWDNSANKFFDTLAAHRPVVINHEGWQADAIREHNFGYVLPPFVTEKVAKDFVDYMNDTKFLKQQGENAYKQAIENYSLEIAADKYIKIFKNINIK